MACLHCWRPLKVEVIPQDGMRFERLVSQLDGLARPVQINETSAEIHDGNGGDADASPFFQNHSSFRWKIQNASFSGSCGRSAVRISTSTLIW